MNKKGSILTIGTLLVFVATITTIFLYLEAKYDIDRDDIDVRIGSHQAGVVKAAQEGEKFRIYVEQAAKISTGNSLAAFGAASGVYPETAESGIGDLEIIDSECGVHVYNKWSNKEKFCAPSEGRTVFNKIYTDDFYALLNRHPLDTSELMFEFENTASDDKIKVIGKSEAMQNVEIFAEDYSYVDLRPVVRRKDKIDEDIVDPEKIEVHWPVLDNDLISSCYTVRDTIFGFGKFHYGIDIPSTNSNSMEKKTVVAALDGKVYSTCPSGSCYPFIAAGKYVILDHGEFYTFYNHLDGISVQPGQEVKGKQPVGIMGNTGRSDGVHLDFKLREGNILNKGKNPLCLYDEEFLNTLQITSSAASCAEKYGGNDPKLSRENPVLWSDCQKLDMGQNKFITSNDATFFERLFADNTRPKTKIGNYYIDPGFVVEKETGLDPAGKTGYYDGLATWAEDVWNSCDDSPSECFNEKLTEFNSDEERNFDILPFEQCEENLLYSSIVKKFVDCLKNEVSECVCKLNLLDIDDNRRHRIVFRNNYEKSSIDLLEPEETSYETEAASTFTSAAPGTDPKNYKNDLELWQHVEDGERKISIGNNEFYTPTRENMYKGRYLYPELIWYKPNPDKMVLVKTQGDYPVCPEIDGFSDDTTLVCAQAKEGDYKVKFALQLRDKLPEGPDEEDVVVSTQESNEGTMEKLAPFLAISSIGLTGLVTPISKPIVEMALEKIGITEKKVQARFFIDTSSAEKDFIGYEVHCGIGDPVSGLDPKNAEGFVSLRDSSLDVDESSIAESLGLPYDHPCEYIKVPFKGSVMMLKKINAFVSDNMASFSLDGCGEHDLLQYVGLSPRVCYTLVPVDEQGNRNEAAAVTKCAERSSIVDRVMEWMDLKAVKDAYLEVSDKAGDVVKGIANQDYEKLWKPIGDFELFEKLNSKEFLDDLRVSFPTQVLKDIKESEAYDEFNKALKDAWDGLPDRSKIDLFDEEKFWDMMDEGYKIEFWERACNEMRFDDAKKLFDRTVDSIGRMRSDELEYFEDVMKNKLLALSMEEKIKALQNSRTGAGAISREIERLRRVSIDRKERDINDLGITEEQTNKLFEDVLKGDHGLQAQQTLAKIASRSLSDASFRSYCKDISGTRGKFKRILREAWSELDFDVKNSIVKGIDDISGWSVEAKDFLIESFPSETIESMYSKMYDSMPDVLERITGENLKKITDPLRDCANSVTGNYDR